VGHVDLIPVEVVFHWLKDEIEGASPAGVTKSAPSTNPAGNGVVTVRGDDGFVAAAAGEGRRAAAPTST
jgi:hypothetical protein